MVHIARPADANGLKDVVFLLGAGASVDAGLPTAVGLTQHVSDDLGQLYPSLVPVLRFIEGAVQFGKSCRGEQVSGKSNIEEILDAATFLDTRQESSVYPFVGAWHEQIVRFHSLDSTVEDEDKRSGLSLLETRRPSSQFGLLRDFCTEMLKKWLKVKDVAKTKYFRDLWDIWDRGYRLHVFTLNYDECLELALHNRFGEINRLWTTGFSENGWTPSLLDETAFSVIVYKLHGSLDWIKDERLGLCSTKWPEARDVEEIAEALRMPQIIFGTTAKLQPVDPFLTLLYKFQQQLRACDVLVILGYSFGDDHINRMIVEALQSNTRKRCIICDPYGRSIIPEDFATKVAEHRLRILEVDAANVLRSNDLLKTIEDVHKEITNEGPF